MRYQQSYKYRLKEHVFYWRKLILSIFIPGSVALWIYTKYINTKDVPLLWLGLALSVVIMMAGICRVLLNYIPFLRYTSSEDYIEVDGNNLWLHRTKACGEGISFPLNRVSTFNHLTKPKSSIELITDQGDELLLEGYDHMEKLVNELRVSPAGKHYVFKK